MSHKYYQLLKRFILHRMLCHGRVLDVGCGEGTFQTEKITGVDVDKNRLVHCPYNFKIQADAQFLPFKSESFDVATEMGCLSYVKDWRKALEEMKRVGKKVYLIEPIRRKNRRHWFSMSQLVEMGTPLLFISKTVVVKAHK